MFTDSDDAPERAKRQPTGDYETGYCRPPKEGQFKKGEPSRNPKGRPRRLQPGGVFEQVSRKKVTYKGGGKTRTATLLELSLQRMFDAAVKGNRKAQGEFLKLWQKVQVAKNGDPAPPSGPLTVRVFAHGVAQKRSVPGASRSPRRKVDRKRPIKRKLELPRDIFNRLAARTVLVREGDVQKRLSYEHVIWRSIFADALKGDLAALALVNRFVDLRYSRAGFTPSDIIDENGVLTVRINLGKPPGLLDDLDDGRTREKYRDDDEEGDQN